MENISGEETPRSHKVMSLGFPAGKGEGGGVAKCSRKLCTSVSALACRGGGRREGA